MRSGAVGRGIGRVPSRQRDTLKSVRPDESRETARVLQAIRERHDCGCVHVAVYELEACDAADADAIMEAAGLEPVAEVELTPTTRVATEVLARDLAYRATIMTNEDAKVLALVVPAPVPRPGEPASYWTNGELLVAQVPRFSSNKEKYD